MKQYYKRYRYPLLILLALVFSEILFRIFLGDYFAIRGDERANIYMFDDYYGWLPKPGIDTEFTGTNTIRVRNNSLGFRDHEPLVDEKKSLLFVGDSFAWGYDVQVEDRYDQHLKELLPDWTINNMAVSGYGTDQTYMLLEKYIKTFKPDVIFHIHVLNDSQDNSTNSRYGDYYKPYFRFLEGKLQLQGVPVPRSYNYFFADHPWLSRICWFQLAYRFYIKSSSQEALVFDDVTTHLLGAMNELARENGAVLVVGMQQKQDEPVELFLQESNIPYVNLNNRHIYRANGFHWTPEGNREVARRMAHLIRELEQETDFAR